MGLPSHILDHSGVRREDGLGVQEICIGRRRLDVPEANGGVIGGAQQMAAQVGVPAQPIAFFGVAAQAQLRLAPSVGCGYGRMLKRE
jgi:hypothetical protein